MRSGQSNSSKGEDDFILWVKNAKPGVPLVAGETVSVVVVVVLRTNDYRGNKRTQQQKGLSEDRRATKGHDLIHGTGLAWIVWLRE